ncbi:MAG: T9SS type A sorting domain-containing protein [Calditrichales bacterium]|nr:MAG: T9SS type A sorting domain-containing protein [Calditrichales bacterium]
MNLKIKTFFGVLVFIFLLQAHLYASISPKHEFRAVWVATVTNIDWPSRYDTPATQQLKLTQLFDNMQACGMNAIIFQVRPECDALYQSSYEPWSYWLTAQQGTAPSPFYDPLSFAIEEAHKRNMELHAWFNPYRAERSKGYFPLDEQHVARQHPDWILDFGSLRLLNPGLPMVRDFVTNVIVDVVRNYDIDGVHFDDYFYPYSGTTTEDVATFQAYPRGFSDIGDWRRDNVNLFVKQVFDSIKAIKPYVKYGISPFGIWKDGVPEGTWGLDAYNEIYCDGVNWLDNRVVDYLTPQIYWSFAGGQNFGLLCSWWAEHSNGRHIYPGHAAYKILNTWGLRKEMPNQVRYTRNAANVFGSVYFSAKQVVANPLGFRDSLRFDLYKYPALMPTMAWLDSIAPAAPQNLVADFNTDGILLNWEAPETSVPEDSAYAYVLYRADGDQSIDITRPDQIVKILQAQDRAFTDTGVLDGTDYHYLVTSLDRLHNESNLSNTIDITYTALASDPEVQPFEFVLKQNYPNPFNPLTQIAFTLPVPGFTKLVIYNVLGEEVKVLVAEELSRGAHIYRFDASRLVSGMYFYRLESGNYQQVKKMVLLK